MKPSVSYNVRQVCCCNGPKHNCQFFAFEVFFAAHLHFELFVERVVVVDVQGRVLTLLLRRVMTLVVDGGVATFAQSNDTENFETNMIFFSLS